VKKIEARFYAVPEADPPSEPVRDWLKGLPQNERKLIGTDIGVVEFTWPKTKEYQPKLIDHIDGDIWEVRTHLPNRIARVLFAVEHQTMLLLHGFIKKTKATPDADKKLAAKRLGKVRRQADRKKRKP
jgi:phage-related protein